MTRPFQSVPARLTLCAFVVATDRSAGPDRRGRAARQSRPDRVVRTGADELRRRVDLHMHHLEAWIAWRRSLLNEMARNAQRLSEEHQRARTVADRAVSVAPGLQSLGSERSSVPHIGWGVFGFFEQHRDRTNAAIAEAMGQVGQGTRRFHISAGGLGFMTRQELEARIASDEVAVQRLSAIGASIWNGRPAI